MLLINHFSGSNHGQSKVFAIEPGLHEVEQRRELTRHVFELQEAGVHWSVDLALATDVEIRSWIDIEGRIGLLEQSEEIRETIDDEDSDDEVIYFIVD